MRYYERTYKRKLYRSRDGIIWGVCQGLADWLGISVSIIRTICLVTFVLSGFFPIAGFYAVAALVLPVEPVSETHHHYYSKERDWERRFHG